MKKTGIFLGAALLTISAFTSCKECKTCEITTTRQIPTDLGIEFDTVVVEEEICGTLLENVQGTTDYEDVAADGTITQRV